MNLNEQDIQPIQQIGRLTDGRVFSHEEALELVPLLMVISSRSKKELNTLNAQLGYCKTGTPKAIDLQSQINRCMQTWSEKIRRLGAIPVSLCKVKIPGETNHYYWEYPETKLFLH